MVLFKKKSEILATIPMLERSYSDSEIKDLNKALSTTGGISEIVKLIGDLQGIELIFEEDGKIRNLFPHKDLQQIDFSFKRIERKLTEENPEYFILLNDVFNNITFVEVHRMEIKEIKEQIRKISVCAEKIRKVGLDNNNQVIALAKKDMEKKLNLAIENSKAMDKLMKAFISLNLETHYMYSFKNEIQVKRDLDYTKSIFLGTF